MRKLVIIDDEAIVVQGITAIINRLNLEVEVVGWANNGLDGCQVVREQKPDVVITDIRMPGLDGLSMIEEVQEEFRDMQFVVISGYTDFVYAQRAIHLGVMDYIDKPITIEKVQEVFSKLEKQDIQKKIKGPRMQGDESVINALMLEEADAFSEAAEDFLEKLEKDCSSLVEFKEECYRFLCLIQGIYAGRRKRYDESMLILYEQIIQLMSESEVKECVRQNVHRISSQMEADQKGANHHVISKLLWYINENYNRDIGLTELGEQVNMNAAYLSILFKEEVGKSYVKYLTDLRISKAKKFLSEGKKVNEVSTMVGFNNYRYFCDVFKKHVGMTPSEYRKEA